MSDSRLFELAEKHAHQENFDEALRVLKKLSPTFLWGRDELLFKARVIQLSDVEFEDGWDFDDVERCLDAALKQDRENIDVLLELGFFHSRVMDDCQKGMSCFQDALRRVEQRYAEGLTGLVECLDEQDSEAAAWQFVEEKLDSLKSKVKDSFSFI